MAIEIKVPTLPESVADAVISVWHKKPGDPIERDENIVDIETDKVVLEVPAPHDGVLTEILQPEGTTVNALQVIAMFEEGAAPAKPAEASAKAESAAAAAPAPASTASNVAGPSARRAAAESGVDASQIPGSGRGGRVTKQDVLSQIGGISGGARTEKRVPMSRLRAKIAERLLDAQHNAAILTTFNEVDMSAVMKLRAEYKDTFEKTHGVRLGFMSFFTKASVEALKRFPAVNASIDGSDVVYHGYFDVGMAVSTPRGLVVPVLRNVENMSMAQIEGTIAEYAKRGRDGKLGLDEITGGTFTITNGGVFGSLMATPIINPPQSGILGLHKIQERVMVENGEMVIRPMMYIALSYDHRIIDGKESVQFLKTIKELIEEPARLLLEV